MSSLLLERSKAAIASWDKPLEIQPDDQESSYNLGVVLGYL